MADITPWIRVSEELPKEGESVVFITSDYVAHYGEYKSGSWIADGGQEESANVRAWLLEYAKPPQVEIDGN